MILVGESQALANRSRPSKDGLIFVRYEDSGQDEEVEISRVTLNLLTAAQ